jgi:hypothetical protein
MSKPLTLGEVGYSQYVLVVGKSKGFHTLVPNMAIVELYDATGRKVEWYLPDTVRAALPDGHGPVESSAHARLLVDGIRDRTRGHGSP